MDQVYEIVLITRLRLCVNDSFKENSSSLFHRVAFDFDGEFWHTFRLRLDCVGRAVYGPLGNKVHPFVRIHLLVDKVRSHARVVIHFLFFRYSTAAG